MAQRQTVLVAKQAACLDVLSGGRFRLGIGVGWNEVEFVGLNENFHNRGRRSEEQVEVMRALWAEPHVSFTGQWHTIDDAGINPLPTGRKIPLWYGGHADVTLRRCAKWGDGWMPLAYAPGDEAQSGDSDVTRYAEAGRARSGDGRHRHPGFGRTRGRGGMARRGARLEGPRRHPSHLANYYESGHLHRIDGRTMTDHLGAMKRYWNAVADLL